MSGFGPGIRIGAAHPPSIRQRLSRALVVVSAAWGLAVSLAVGLAVHHEVDDLLDNGLQESAEILYGLLSFNAEAVPGPVAGGTLPAPPHDERLVWQLVNAQGQVILRSHKAPEQALLGLRTRGFASVGSAWRVFAMPAATGGAMLYVAQRGGARREAQIEAALVTAGTALLVGLLCAAWLRRRVRAELAVVSALSASVARYDPLLEGSLLDPAEREELVPMRDAVDGLGRRLAERVASERAFSAHSAHALRTPLAGLVAQLAVAQREAPLALQPRLARARAAADRLRRVVNALLTMFRSGSEVAWLAVDVAALVGHLPLDGLAVDCAEAGQVQGDADLLAAALVNLLDNAARHGATRVSIRREAAPTGPVLVLQDDGNGLAPEAAAQLQALLDARDYQRPVGLGLTLADLVARAHGGRLRLRSGGGGLQVMLVLGNPPRPDGH